MKELTINEVKEVSGAVSYGGPIGGAIGAYFFKSPWAAAVGAIAGQHAEDYLRSLNWKPAREYGRAIGSWPFYQRSAF